MKKLFCLLLGLAFLGGIVFTTGCGSSGSGGILAAFAAVLVFSAVTASTGGAGAAAFAASVRPTPRAAIVATVNTKYEARIYVKDPDWRLATVTTNLELSADGKTLSFPSTNKPGVNVSSSKVEYRIEFVAIGAPDSTDMTKASPNAYLCQYDVSTLTHGESKDVTLNVDPEDTAKALAYDAWTGKNTTGLYFTDFSPDSTKLSTAKTAIEGELNTKLATPQPTFTYTVTTSNAVTAAGTSAVVPSATSVTTYSVSGKVIAADGTSGSEGTTMTLTSTTDSTKTYTATTVAGNYQFDSVPNGTYTLVPTKTSHTFTPTSATVTVNGANVTVANFQAAVGTAPTTPANFNGTWSVVSQSGTSQPQTGTMKITQSGTTVTVTQDLVNITNATVNGGSISFTRSGTSGTAWSDQWNGTINSAETAMSGTWIDLSNPSNQGTWYANKTN